MKALVIGCWLLAVGSRLSAQLSYSAYVDAYYGFDFNKPLRDRAFTTQALRHNEPNINLAFVDASFSTDRWHGRVAVQGGTSVRANYVAEPGRRGPGYAGMIQEAFLGVRAAKSLWIDAGVMLAPFGSENWASRDNWTYTRSLIAENSPYYEAGLRSVWQASRNVSVEGHIMNGWQRISETNGAKTFGGKVSYSASTWSLWYDACVGNDAPRRNPAAQRVFQEVAFRSDTARRVAILATFDYGMQKLSGTSQFWRGAAVVGRVSVNGRVRAAARAEMYSDPQQTIVATGLPYGLRAAGGSTNVDVTVTRHVLWRTELRALRGRDAVFPTTAAPARTNTLVVTSLALH